MQVVKLIGTLKTALGASDFTQLLPARRSSLRPASAGERQSYLGDGAPATLRHVRRIFVAPA